MARSILEELYGNPVIDVSAAGVREQRPTAWQMAQSATTAAVKFAAGGMRRVSPERQAERVKQCAGCVQYDGTQCGICGCVIAVKSWFPAEKCPLGKWESS